MVTARAQFSAHARLVYLLLAGVDGGSAEGTEGRSPGPTRAGCLDEVGKVLPRWEHVPAATCGSDVAVDRAHLERSTTTSEGRQAAAAASRPLRVRRWKISSKVARAPVGPM